MQGVSQIVQLWSVSTLFIQLS